MKISSSYFFMGIVIAFSINAAQEQQDAYRAQPVHHFVDYNNRVQLFQERSQEDYDVNQLTKPCKKSFDYICCESRNSFCIRRRIYPKCCERVSGIAIVSAGSISALTKYLLIGAIMSPEHPENACDGCACSRGWFPAAQEELICNGSRYSCCDSHDLRSWIICSSVSLIISGVLCGCWVTKKCCEQRN